MFIPWKVAFHWGHLLMAAAPGLFAVLLLLGAGPTPVPSSQDFGLLFGYSLPPLAALMVAGIPARESEVGVSELYLSYAQSPVIRTLIYLAGGLSLWLAGGIGAVAVASLQIPVTNALWLAGQSVAPVFALGGAAAGCSAFTKHRGGGLFLALVWWTMDGVAPGLLNRYLYLFGPFRPIPGVDVAMQTRNLWIAGAFFWAITFWLVARRERWVR